MTRDELVSLIKSRCKRVNDTGIDASIVAEMQFVVEQILETGPIKPWFLLSSWTALAITSGNDTVALPADFLWESEEHKIEIYSPTDAEYVPLDKADAGAANKYFIDDEAQQPQVYSIEGEEIVFRPVPDQGYTARIKYFYRDDSLATNIENQWTKYAADLVAAETGRVIAKKYLRDDALAAEFASDATAAWMRLNSSVEARKVMGQSTAMQYG